jgi:hypothetical protein
MILGLQICFMAQSLSDDEKKVVTIMPMIFALWLWSWYSASQDEYTFFIAWCVLAYAFIVYTLILQTPFTYWTSESPSTKLLVETIIILCLSSPSLIICSYVSQIFITVIYVTLFQRQRSGIFNNIRTINISSVTHPLSDVQLENLEP